MIFATVGSQAPFDRLVAAVDAWAGANPAHEVLVQIGHGQFVPRHAAWTRFLDPPEFSAIYDAASLVVAHAGTGSILHALAAGRPIVVLPRRAALHETRNDHQLATCRGLAARGLTIAWDEAALATRLGEAAAGAASPRGPRIGPHASPALLGALRAFVLAPPPRAPWA